MHSKCPHAVVSLPPSLPPLLTPFLTICLPAAPLQSEVKLASQAAQNVKQHALTILELKEEADQRLEAARRVADKARKKAEEKVRELTAT